MLTIQNTEAIRQIEEAIGYTFRDKRLLVQVFTRKTYTRIDPEAPDNEVLEFYGDTILSYHVTNYFVGKFAHMLNDGLYFMRTVEQFTEMRSHYVRNQYLTDRIKQLLPPIERLLRAQNPRSELPKDNQKAYADLFESLVGAVYLDSCQDDELIRAFILRHLLIEPKPMRPAQTATRRSQVTVLPSVDISANTDMTATDDMADEPSSMQDTDIEPISPLESFATPTPLPVETADSHISTVALEEPDSPLLNEQSEKTPSLSGLLPEAVSSSPSTVSVLPAPTHREALIAFCRQKGCEPPVFGEAPKNAPNARPVAACTLRYRNAAGRTVKISLNDSGKTLYEAEEKVAAKMLRKLEKEIASDVSSPTASEASALANDMEMITSIPVVSQELPPKTAAETPAVSETLSVEADSAPAAVLSDEIVQATTADDMTDAETEAKTKATPASKAKKTSKATTAKPRSSRKKAVPVAETPTADAEPVPPIEANPQTPDDAAVTVAVTAEETAVTPKSSTTPAKRTRRATKKAATESVEAEVVTAEVPVEKPTPPKKPSRRRTVKKADETAE